MRIGLDQEGLRRKLRADVRAHADAERARLVSSPGRLWELLEQERQARAYLADPKGKPGGFIENEARRAGVPLNYGAAAERVLKKITELRAELEQIEDAEARALAKLDEAGDINSALIVARNAKERRGG